MIEAAQDINEENVSTRLKLGARNRKSLKRVLRKKQDLWRVSCSQYVDHRDSRRIFAPVSVPRPVEDTEAEMLVRIKGVRTHRDRSRATMFLNLF